MSRWNHRGHESVDRRLPAGERDDLHRWRSKDDLDIDSGPWLWKNGSVPDKDNLRHGFAARYDDHLYFGADRAAANGDAALGVWFFQSAVAPSPGSGDQPFIGEHLNGDILVLTDFTGGGGTVTARVFQWNGPGGTSRRAR